ncbi:NADH-quinone oxidoreductase subunit NuoN [Aliikangiella marina]|uniref:NADH-quinone oxidoreductase subunit N n=1 Tax=Aliikangiella marina TaxID=1712262 RepID=A0A545TC76_9GAMM|nr:NADH-quinone oxidoreductase subunit NuoN [Aliikangiella marina]TQV74825.1 NADH-quinone oxidoreductase subunit NuoN [Aliikangiella marina]
MNQSINFSLLTSEVFLLCAICVILIVDLFQRDKERKLTFNLTLVSLVTLFILDVNQINVLREVGFYGHWVQDQLAVILKLAIYATTFIALLYARPFINHRALMRGEYYILTLFSVLGMMIMVSANSFLIVYLGLELLSLSLYALIALQRDSKSASESAVKYFVMGGLASGFLLYGISLMYGATGSILIADVAAHFNENQSSLIGKFGLVFIVIGLAFKFGAVPFHMWLPDIYHGAPSSISAFISSVPKIAAFGMAMRLLVEAFSQLVTDWSTMILILALLSVIFGNLIAVVQTNLKRLLAYSAIAHIGYFLLGIVTATPEGNSAAMFYIIVYALMTVAGFGIVILMSTEEKEYQNISDLRGLGRFHPWYGLMFAVVMVSMAGIPPFLGFWPKLEIFRQLILNDYIVEAVIAIAFSVVGLFYYLKVIKEMFFTDATDSPEITSSRSLKVAISVNCLLLVIIGLMPDSIFEYCISAFKAIS